MFKFVTSYNQVRRKDKKGLHPAESGKVRSSGSKAYIHVVSEDRTNQDTCIAGPYDERVITPPGRNPKS